MKLPDFLTDHELNELRKVMRAELGGYQPASLSILTAEEIEQLQTEGIEIPIDNVQVLNDGTYVYKGRRVVVHIRDIEEYGDRYSLPRFHLAMCSTLGQMIEHGRYQKRYVVSTRDDGRFRIHRIRNGNIKKLEEPLDVCQNCLEELHYENFSLQMSASKRKMAVQKFSLKTFFDEFGRTCVWATPRYDDKHAPPNVYSVQFYRIAQAIKESSVGIVVKIKSVRLIYRVAKIVVFYTRITLTPTKATITHLISDFFALDVTLSNFSTHTFAIVQTTSSFI